jgi:hypothetical protein
MKKQDNPTSKKSISIGNILITVVLIIITALFFGDIADRTRFETDQIKLQEQQDKISSLEQKITGLEQGNKTTQQLPAVEVTDKNALENQTGNCSNDASSDFQRVDEDVVNTLKTNNKEFAAYTDQGYSLREICRYKDKFLLFFDFSTGFFKKAGKIDESELSKLGSKTLIGVADSTYTTIAFYPAIIDYSPEAEGSMACNLNKLDDSKISYVCENANDGGIMTRWYEYDITRQKNTEIKYSFVSWPLENT